MGYVDYEVPAELVPQVVEMLSVAKDGGKVKKGINETTKAIERKTAQLVVVAGDVTPEEIVVHIPILCKENGIPYVFVPTKKDLGGAVGIAVGTSAVAVENPGAATEKLQDIIKKLPKHEKKK
jgi:large subunit ribosomal protein L7Ae